MTNEQITHLRKLLADASPGDWEAKADTYIEEAYNPDGENFLQEFTQGWDILDATGYAVVSCEGILAHHKDYAALIVALRNNAAAMLDEIERLRAERATLLQSFRDIKVLVSEAVDVERIGCVTALDAISDVARAALGDE